MQEPRFGVTQYRGLTVADMRAHIDFWRSKPIWPFDLLLCPTGIAIPLKQQVYKTKPTELQLILRSGSVGREALDAICDDLKQQQFNLKIRHSPKLRLISRAVAAIPIDDPDFETRFSGLLKLIAKKVGLRMANRNSRRTCKPHHKVSRTAGRGFSKHRDAGTWTQIRPGIGSYAALSRNRNAAGGSDLFLLPKLTTPALDHIARQKL